MLPLLALSRFRLEPGNLSPKWGLLFLVPLTIQIAKDLPPGVSLGASLAGLAAGLATGFIARKKGA